MLREGISASPAEASGKVPRLDCARVAHLEAQEELLKLSHNRTVLFLLLVLGETLFHAQGGVRLVNLSLRQLLFKIILDPLIIIPKSINMISHMERLHNNGADEPFIKRVSELGRHEERLDERIQVASGALVR